MPHETMVHRVLAPLGQKGMVCWLFLTGMAGTTGGYWGTVGEAESNTEQVVESYGKK